MEEKITIEPEVKEVQPEKTEEKQPEQTVEKADEKTIGEVLQTEPKEEVKKEKPDSVPFNVFEMSKKENKQLKQKIKELEEKAEGGEDVSSDLEDIADEYNVDKGFLKKIEKRLESKIAERLEGVVESKIKPLTDKERAKNVDNTLNELIGSALEKMPEFKNIVNEKVIKTLAMQKDNVGKTISKLIEETYGNAIPGKRSTETTTPGGGKAPTEIDFERARKDTEYFKEIMADPDLKKKYNSNIERRISW